MSPSFFLPVTGYFVLSFKKYEYFLAPFPSYGLYYGHTKVIRKGIIKNGYSSIGQKQTKNGTHR
jgi:hypothetical protein